MKSQLMQNLKTAIVALLLFLPCLVSAQQTDVTVDYNNPHKYIVGGVSVSGNHYFGNSQIVSLTGLQKGM